VNDRPLSVLLAGDYAADPTLGSPKVFYKLQTEFEALGHSCDVMFGDEIGGPRSRQIRQLVEPAFAARAIGKRLARTRYDIVDAASAEGLWFGAARRLGRHRGAAYVCRSNGIEHLNYRRMLDDAAAGLASKPWSRRVWYPVSRLSQVAAAARVADRVLLLNETDRRFAIDRRWQTPDRIDVVPHGVSAAFLDDDPGEASPRGRGLLFCGSWDPVKGIPYLVAAYERMLANGAVWPLTILGPGIPAADVLAAFSDRARAGITVIPRAPESDVLRAYREHDALLWTSTYEGFGLVLIEAMSQRLPVVATPVGCAPDVVDDGVTGLRVPARAGEAVASAAAHLMDDPELRLRLGAAARARVMGMSWRATAERTVDVYRRALSAVAAG
jgi:glycosyltransferase involved in cell wall biosynthesis